MQQFGREMRQAAQAANQTGDTTQVEKLAASYEGARKTVAALQRQVRATNATIAESAASVAAINSEFSALSSSLTTMTTRVRNWGAVFVASVTGAAVALGKLTTTAARSLDDLDDMASATGTTTQEIEKLQLVAAKAGDQGFETINKALERTTKAMGLATIEAQKLNNVTDEFGRKRDFSDPFKAVFLDASRFTDSIHLLEEWAARVDAIADPTIRAAIAADLLGKNWARVLPTLKNLRAEMEQAERDIVAGGGFTSQQSIEATNQFLGVLGKLEGQFRRLRDAAGAQLAAAMMPALNALSAWVGQNMPVISAWIVNAAGYLKALTNDLVKFFILGQPGSQTEWGAAIINALVRLQTELIPGVTAAWNSMMSVLNGVAAAINAVFGTNLTGGQVGLAIVIGQVTGALNLMVAALSALGALLMVGGGIAAALTPAGWLVAGLVAINVAVLTLTGSWEALGKTIMAVVNSVWGGIQVALQGLKDLASAAAAVNPFAPAAPAATAPIPPPPRPMASGGMVPGSGNRDSFPAWLMPGEFVIRKSIVSALGADFFAGLNRGMGSLLPRSSYATGGLVMAEPPGGGTPVHLHIGGGSFPLNGAPAVVSALVVEAHRQHVRSAGVKPSWYGGR